MNPTLTWNLLLQEMKKVFSYRVNFWLQYVFQIVGELAVAYFLWVAIFASTGREIIGGYSLSEMIRYYVFVALAKRLISGAESYTVSNDIYEGGLTKYLLYPANYFIFKLTEHLAFMLLSLFQLVLGLAALSLLMDLNILEFMTPQGFLMGMALGITASIFYFCLLSTIELIAFWADNIWSLNVMAKFMVGFFGGLMLPLSLYPDWALKLLAFTPFPSMASIPIRLLLGEVGASEFLTAQLTLALWFIPMSFVALLVWRRGIHQYSGIGQ